MTGVDPEMPLCMFRWREEGVLYECILPYPHVGVAHTPSEHAGRRNKVASARMTLVLRLKPELHERLRAAAEDRDLSMAWLTTKAIERLLDDLIPAEEWKLTR